MKLGDKITLKIIPLVSKSINRQVTSIFCDWFTFLGTHIAMKIADLQLTMLIFHLFKPKNMVVLV